MTDILHVDYELSSLVVTHGGNHTSVLIYLTNNTVNFVNSEDSLPIM